MKNDQSCPIVCTVLIMVGGLGALPVVAEETSARAALDKPLSFDVAGTPLSDVLGLLKDLANIEFVLDESAASKADTAITLKVDKMRLASVLSNILRPAKLQYRIRGNKIQIYAASGSQSPRSGQIPSEIREKLNREVSTEFEKTPLQSVVGFLSNMSGTNIIVDSSVRNKDLPITLKVNKVPLRQVISQITKQAKLVSSYRDEAIVIHERQETK
jgi:type II secretory pathway component GspD/PulD (secretin)